VVELNSSIFWVIMQCDNPEDGRIKVMCNVCFETDEHSLFLNYR
jgi:hypothetical protein